jgi:hypothetical protein
VHDWLPANVKEKLANGQTLDDLHEDTAKALLQHLTAVPADEIGSIAPSQVLADARAAGARPEHVLDAVAVGIASVIAPVVAPVTGTDFFDLLPEIAADVQTSALGWLAENHGIAPASDSISFDTLGSGVVAGMLDHIKRLASEYDMYAHDRSTPEETTTRRIRPRDRS